MLSPHLKTVFDLASLTKPLVTAPLALEYLDIECDQRDTLGFTTLQDGPLTVRQLLSHSAGLPPWLPYTGIPLSKQLQENIPWGIHPLLQKPAFGYACYSDLGFRLLAELIEHKTGADWYDLGKNITGLHSPPWSPPPYLPPAAEDKIAWHYATPEVPIPLPDPQWPHDINARAGMKGHAGFGADIALLEKWIKIWVDKYAPKMVVETARARDGKRWGLSMWRVPDDEFAELLYPVKEGIGQKVWSTLDADWPSDIPSLPKCALYPSEWWMHTGFTGPVLFFRPRDRACFILLVHRCGPAGELLDHTTLRARRWWALARYQETWV